MSVKLIIYSIKETSNMKNNNVSLELSSEKKSSYGSLIILFSLLIVGVIYLLWNKQTYQQLYNLGKLI